MEAIAMIGEVTFIEQNCLFILPVYLFYYLCSYIVVIIYLMTKRMKYKIKIA